MTEIAHGERTSGDETVSPGTAQTPEELRELFDKKPAKVPLENRDEPSPLDRLRLFLRTGIGKAAALGATALTVGGIASGVAWNKNEAKPAPIATQAEESNPNVLPPVPTAEQPTATVPPTDIPSTSIETLSSNEYVAGNATFELISGEFTAQEKAYLDRTTSVNLAGLSPSEVQDRFTITTADLDPNDTHGSAARLIYLGLAQALNSASSDKAYNSASGQESPQAFDEKLEEMYLNPAINGLYGGDGEKTADEPTRDGFRTLTGRFNAFGGSDTRYYLLDVNSLTFAPMDSQQNQNKVTVGFIDYLVVPEVTPEMDSDAKALPHLAEAFQAGEYSTVTFLLPDVSNGNRVVLISGDSASMPVPPELVNR